MSGEQDPKLSPEMERFFDEKLAEAKREIVVIGHVSRDKSSLAATIAMILDKERRRV